MATRVTQFQKGYDEALLDVFDAFKAGGATRALQWIADNAEGRMPGLAREVRDYVAARERGEDEGPDMNEGTEWAESHPLVN